MDSVKTNSKGIREKKPSTSDKLMLGSILCLSTEVVRHELTLPIGKAALVQVKAMKPWGYFFGRLSTSVRQTHPIAATLLHAEYQTDPTA
jgi:hypothetical protein